MPIAILVAMVVPIASVAFFPAGSIGQRLGVWSLFPAMTTVAVAMAAMPLALLAIHPSDPLARKWGVWSARVLGCTAASLLIGGVMLGVQREAGHGSAIPRVAPGGHVLTVAWSVCGAVACWLTVLLTPCAHPASSPIRGFFPGLGARGQAFLSHAAITSLGWTAAAFKPADWFPEALIAWALVTLYLATFQVKDHLILTRSP
ncbi:MAG: hypothetical protein JNK70_04195 [Phycisphaerae bacterium]|nr:hypothetical protein [Phycisphaerae bacterium]